MSLNFSWLRRRKAGAALYSSATFGQHSIAVTTEEEERTNSMSNLSEAIYNNGRREQHKETLKEKRRADAAEKRADAISKQLDDANKRLDASDQLIRELKLQLAAST